MVGFIIKYHDYNFISAWGNFRVLGFDGNSRGPWGRRRRGLFPFVSGGSGRVWPPGPRRTSRRRWRFGGGGGRGSQTRLSPTGSGGRATGACFSAWIRRRPTLGAVAVVASGADSSGGGCGWRGDGGGHRPTRECALVVAAASAVLELAAATTARRCSCWNYPFMA
jgi:hypothetical protein